MVGGNVVFNSAEAGSPQAFDRRIKDQMEHSAFALIVIEDRDVLIALGIGKAAENSVEVVV
jgi:hypothetical protein